MRAVVVGMLAGSALALTGCGSQQTSGIVAIGPDTYAVETRGRSLSTAVERGLTEATSFCTAQSRQTELLGTRINADSYQVAFRCTGGTGLAGNPGIIGRVPAGFATRNSSLGPIPVTSGRTVISGQAFPPAPPPPSGFDMGTVGAMPGRTATVAGNPFAQAAPLPAARQPTSLPPLSSLNSPAGPLAFQAPSASSGSVPPVAPSPFAPLQSPLAAPAPAPAFAPPAAPAFTPAAPASASFPAPSFAPLTSPLAAPAATTPAATAPTSFQPLSSPAAAPPSGFQPLPGAARPLSVLPPVASPTRGGSAVPSVASGAPLGEAPGVVPPPAFWNSPR